MRPVAALETTEAVTPNASKTPRAPSGSWKLSRIEGHTRPRVEPGNATVRYARQARRKGGTVVTPLSQLKAMPQARGSTKGARAGPRVGSLCRTSEQHAMTGRHVTYCVNVCVVARAPQLLGVLVVRARPRATGAPCRRSARAAGRSGNGPSDPPDAESGENSGEAEEDRRLVALQGPVGWSADRSPICGFWRRYSRCKAVCARLELAGNEERPPEHPEECRDEEERKAAPSSVHEPAWYLVLWRHRGLSEGLEGLSLRPWEAASSVRRWSQRRRSTGSWPVMCRSVGRRDVISSTSN